MQEVFQEPAPQILQQYARTVCTGAATDCVEAGPSAEHAEAPPSVVSTPEPAPDSGTRASSEAQLAAALAESSSSSDQALHPGVHGSSSVSVDRFEDQQVAMVTIRAAVRLTPCSGGGSGACVVLEEEPRLDMAAAFASSVASQAANSCCKCAHLCLLFTLILWRELAFGTDVRANETVSACVMRQLYVRSVCLCVIGHSSRGTQVATTCVDSYHFLDPQKGSSLTSACGNEVQGFLECLTRPSNQLACTSAVNAGS